MSKARLPASVNDLLNGAALPAPVRPVEFYDIAIPTAGTDARRAWKMKRHDERLDAANARAVRDRLDLPF